MGYRRRNEKERTEALSIGSLLERYRRVLRPPQGIVLDAFCAAAEEYLSAPLPRTAVQYNVHTQTVSVRVGGPHKSEILLHKHALLATCREVLGERNAPKHIV